MSNQYGPLYVSDLDGTLLRNDGTISEFSTRRLNQLLDDGLIFTVASARSVVSMGHILQDVRITLPVIEFNGAFLSDLRTGCHYWVNAIPSQTLAELYAIITQLGGHPFISCVDQAGQDLLFYNRAVNDGMQWYVNEKLRMRDRRLCQIGCLRDALSDQVVCLTIIDRREPLETLFTAINEQLPGLAQLHLFENPYQNGWYWLTVHDIHATKAHAIRRLAERYDLSLERLTVFGDHMNDVTMFQMATHAIATANAQDELKRHATRVVGANEDDSVVKYLLTT